MYGLRRIRDAFRSNRSLSDPGIIEAKFLEGKKSLEVVKRQVNILLTLRSIEYDDSKIYIYSNLIS